MNTQNFMNSLEEIQVRLSGGVALVDILAAAMLCSPDEQITEAVYAAARYLRDTSSRLTDVIEDARGRTDAAGGD